MSIDLSFRTPDEFEDAEVYVFKRGFLEKHDPENELLKLLDHPILALGKSTCFGFEDVQAAADILMKAVESMTDEGGEVNISIGILGDAEFNERMQHAFAAARARMTLAASLAGLH